jgi:hypothetical protein
MIESSPSSISNPIPIPISSSMSLSRYNSQNTNQNNKVMYVLNHSPINNNPSPKGISLNWCATPP